MRLLKRKMPNILKKGRKTYELSEMQVRSNRCLTLASYLSTFLINFIYEITNYSTERYIHTLKVVTSFQRKIHQTLSHEHSKYIKNGQILQTANETILSHSTIHEGIVESSGDLDPLKSPLVTPIKPLPFSPSQFFNSPSLNISFDINIPASTPVRRQPEKVNTKCGQRLYFICEI